MATTIIASPSALRSSRRTTVATKTHANAQCDHKRPSCGLCSKLNLGCEYPPPQARRGPVAGLGKKAEARVQQCENALWWVLAIPDVAELVRRHADNVS